MMRVLDKFGNVLEAMQTSEQKLHDKVEVAVSAM
jgi:hypothetical protein